MSKRDIRENTVIILRRGNEYLVGTVLGGHFLNWSTSPYDAWGTRNKGIALIVAEKVGADMWLWNPIVSQLKLLKRVEKKGGLTVDDYTGRYETPRADQRDGQPDYRGDHI